MMELDTASSEQIEKSKRNNKEESLKNIFNEFFSGNKMICIKGRRKTGKTTFAMEIIAQTLISNPENEVLLFSTLGNFNAKKFADICESYFEDKDFSKQEIRVSVKMIMKRLRILELKQEKDFYLYLQCLEALILGLPKLSLIVIDSLSFFHTDSYVFEKIYNKPLTREMFLNYYSNIFSNLIENYKISIIYTLPQHLVREYLCSRDFADSDNDEKERNIYEHFKTKAEQTTSHKYPVSEEEEVIQFQLTIDELQQSPDANEGNSKNPDPTPVGTTQKIDVVDAFNLSDMQTLSSDLQDKKYNSPDLMNVPLSDDQAAKEDPNTNDSSEIDSSSDGEKSGEGYKSESGTESGSVKNEIKISDKAISLLHRHTKPDVVIKLLNISSNSYMMQIKNDFEQLDFNFDITEIGIEWDDIPAEK